MEKKTGLGINFRIFELGDQTILNRKWEQWTLNQNPAKICLLVIGALLCNYLQILAHY